MYKTLFMLLAMLLPSSLHAARLNVKFMPLEARVELVQGKVTNRLKNPGAQTIKPGNYTLLASAPGYRPYSVPFTASNRNIVLETKLEKLYPGLELISIHPVQGQPKSIVWLDRERFAVNLLSGAGVQLFRFTNDLGVISPTNGDGRHKGFVEGWIDREKGLYLQSQMTTGRYHLYDLSSMQYLRSYSTQGNWTKVIAADSRYYYFSNWLSETVTVLSRTNHQLIARVKTAGIPRGLAVTPDEKYLYVTVFDDALLQKIDLATMKVVKNIRLSPSKGAARHLVIDPRRGLMYISDMGRAEVHKYDLSTDRILGTVKVYSKPNTITLSPDGHRLFVSCRGPNGPDGYLEKGIYYGQVYVIDTVTMQAEDWIWGQNQPTGLDISPDGRYLVIGDFFDNQIEIYRVMTGLIRGSYQQ